jgi:hypothetical protein
MRLCPVLPQRANKQLEGQVKAHGSMMRAKDKALSQLELKVRRGNCCVVSRRAETGDSDSFVGILRGWMLI